MSEFPNMGKTIQQGAYVLVFLLVAFVRLLPLETLPPSFVGPDMLLVITFAWIARSPATLSVLTIACVFLMADVLFHRPPGLWAAIVLLGSENFRQRSGELRRNNSIFEFFAFSLTLLAMIMVFRFCSLVFILEQAPLRLVLTGYVSTLVAYPVVAFALRFMRGATAPRRDTYEFERY